MNAYLELTKPRLASLVMLSTFVGFFLAHTGTLDYALLIYTIVGTSLVAAGSLALNEWMERDLDALMERTKSRPIPSGKISPKRAFIFGVILSVIGFVILLIWTPLATFFYAVLTWATYLFLYTPLKTRTSLCTIAGAIPGALPPLIGWSACRGSVSFEAWVLFAIIFLWQMPHFLAIAWLYKEDFKKAGFKMLSLFDESGKRVSRQMILYTSALIPVSLAPTFLGMAGRTYFFVALFLGIFILVLGIKSLKKIDEMMSPLFRVSILYLTLIFIFLIVDKS